MRKKTRYRGGGFLRKKDAWKNTFWKIPSQTPKIGGRRRRRRRRRQRKSRRQYNQRGGFGFKSLLGKAESAAKGALGGGGGGGGLEQDAENALGGGGGGGGGMLQDAENALGGGGGGGGGMLQDAENALGGGGGGGGMLQDAENALGGGGGGGSGLMGRLQSAAGDAQEGASDLMHGDFKGALGKGGDVMKDLFGQTKDSSTGVPLLSTKIRPGPLAKPVPYAGRPQIPNIFGNMAVQPTSALPDPNAVVPHKLDPPEYSEETRLNFQNMEKLIQQDMQELFERSPDYPHLPENPEHAAKKLPLPKPRAGVGPFVYGLLNAKPHLPPSPQDCPASSPSITPPTIQGPTPLERANIPQLNPTRSVPSKKEIDVGGGPLMFGTLNKKVIRK